MSSDSLRLRFRQLQCHGHHSKVSELYKGLLRYHVAQPNQYLLDTTLFLMQLIMLPHDTC